MRTRFVASSLAILLLAAGAVALRLPRAAANLEPASAHAGASEGGMAAAARTFLKSLTPELLAAASSPLDGPARTDWHYIPRARPGVSLGQMSEPQRIAARNLLRAALSAHGVLKAEIIMSLDQVLRDMEKAMGRSGDGRDPLAYFFLVFGEPPAAPGHATTPDTAHVKPWGWKIEGHHLSLNFTLTPDGADGWRTDLTPSFFGANPAEVRSGPRAGLRALAEEEDLGRELVTSLDAGQRARAVLRIDAPGDVLTSPGRNLDVAAAEGLGAAEMTLSQRELLERLISEYAGNLRSDLAVAALSRIHAEGIGSIRFAWAGSLEKGRPHYYRISGPMFVIEYDNTQNDANHVHTVWHDRQRDFGHDALAEHLQDHDHGHKHEQEK